MKDKPWKNALALAFMLVLAIAAASFMLMAIFTWHSFAALKAVEQVHFRGAHEFRS